MTISPEEHPMAGKWAGPTAEIAQWHDAPTLMVEGQPVPPMWFTGWVNGEDTGYLQALGAAGMRVFFVPHYLEWNGPTALEQLRETAMLILRTVPDAWLILRTGLYPPESWLDANPEELIQFSDGTPMETWFGKGTRIQCLCSRKWREEQTQQLASFLDWLPDQPFAHRVLGFFLCAGGTGEWYIPGHIVHGEQTIDHSAAFRTQFSATLRETYASDAALRAAWRQPEVTREAPPIPGAADYAYLDVERALFAHYHGEDVLPSAPVVAGAIGSFCNPDTHQHVADMLHAVNDGAADSIIHFARFLKERTGGRAITGSFYGSFGLPTGGTSTGVVRILDSGAIDFLSSPGDYVNRQPGGVVAQREMQQSFRLRNRIFVVEEDTRTLATNPSPDWGVNTLGESIEVMKRDFGRNLSEDLAAWWFDMVPAGHASRWYRFPKMLEMIRRQQEVAQALYAGPRAPHPEIALIYDQASMRYTAGYTLADIGHRTRSWEIHRLGAPVAYHYLDDLDHPAMPDYKLCVFMNAFVLDDQQRASVQRFLARSGCTALWLYAPGIINPAREHRFDSRHVEEVTGLRVRLHDGAALPYCRLTPDGARRLPDVRTDWDYGWFTDRESFGTIESHLQTQGMAQFSLLCPYLTGEEDQGEVLMRFNADGRPALVMLEDAHGRHLTAFFKAVRAEIYRAVARLAGCHIYSTSDDVLYAGPRMVTLHAGSSGEKLIHLPAPADPFEIYQRTAYGHGVRDLRFSLRMGETRTFHLQGEI